MRARQAAPLLFLTAALGAVEASAQTPAAADESLREIADQLGVQIGAAVAVPALDVPAYRATLAREFNTVVAENAFKWPVIHPAEGVYDFSDADRVVAEATANGQAIRGHTLIWDQTVPEWLDRPGTTREDAIAAMRDHIHTVVGRYRGRVAAWDVVNEAIDDGSNQLRTDSVWFRLIGPDYVALAFRFAHEADPAARLYYNDTRTEDMGAKSEAVYALLRDLLGAGVPIHGVGWQMHVEDGFVLTDAHRANADRIAELGLELTITELDVRLRLPAGPADLERQGHIYREVTGFCLAQWNCRGVLTWGFTDAFSWIPEFMPGWGAGLLFDADYGPKPAYYGVRDALAERRHAATGP